MTDRLTRNRSKYWPDKTLHEIKLEEPKMDSKLSEDEIVISKPKKLKTSSKLPVSTKAVKSIELPPNWKVIYDNIVQMRKETPAVVDTMGCSHWADKNIDPKVSRFQVLVSLMLSSQTRDEVTYATMVELKKNGLSVEYIDNISTSELEAMINKVGFYRRKAAFIKKTANTLKEVYDGDIPSTLEELIKLPGVGPKMANLTMQEAWNKVTGIAVDTHVHRITNRLKWVKTKTPEQTQAELEAKVPREHWRDFNHLLVGFGQSICRPVKPKCSECLNCTICPSSTNKYLF
ncbi:hypothetical protein RDWZM_008413 [Blomia tropicalis]|uniref:Endonuclease III homolog n=1 Tax=Blomia tropicalis TaxID=40697 RepID=A0A9Q0RLE2_BLOTA|nr:Endonuclease III-like protein 1 [Blomia tropicalis]KAJ6217256.1 hypothetical protein RDWZM_008413 [Blomia tropicalis]